jgi:hypothetical protein
MNYWIHRISYHAELSYPLLEKGILSIGFSDWSSKDFLKNCRNNWDEFEKQWEDKKRNRYNLWRFISDMEKGDYVLIPSEGVFSVYEITDNNPFSIEDLNVNKLKDWLGNSGVVGENVYLYNTDANDDENIITFSN